MINSLYGIALHVGLLLILPCFIQIKKQTEEFLPELYKALCFIDDKGYSWYPNSVIQENKSMLFAEGKSISDWKWSAVKSKDGKPDMTTKKEFEQGDFAKALVYIS